MIRAKITHYYPSYKMHLHLYSTSHCHLCEKAESFLQSIKTFHPISWEVKEIFDDEQLFTRYETSIPVIRRLDTAAELAWPFSELDLKLFLNLVANSSCK